MLQTSTLSSPSKIIVSADALRHAIVWLMMVSSFLVIVEPAPCDLLFLLAVVLFSVSGLSISTTALPLVALQLLFLLGGFTSLALVLYDTKAILYIITSSYMVLSSIFFAFYLGKDTEKRTDLVVNGWTIGALIATVFGLIGAFDIAGTGSWMSLQGRAQGLFKDPNVYSTYVIFPGVILFQRLLIGKTQHVISTILMLLFILAGLFIAFSRGAYINFIGASAVVVLISFILSETVARRLRIVVIVLVGVVASVVLLSGLLLIEPVRDLFLERFSLVQSYDGGETGRFGNQLLSLPMLLVSPLGFGPIQFRHLFYQDPHNVFINAFASYGWLGGFSYLAVVISTLIVGVKSLISATRVQPTAIAAFAVFLSTVLQGVQIDTDHWRHFYWLMGIVWGLYAAQASGYISTDDQT